MDNVTTKKNKLVTAIQGAVKSAIPTTKGGKVVAGVSTTAIAVGSFMLGRLTKGKKSNK
jgi:hypothetical protein